MMTVVGAIALRVGLYLALGAAFVIAAWRLHRRASSLGLVSLWLVVSAVYGYVRYRVLCAQPLTCDVIGPGWTLDYFIRNAPIYAAMGVVIFGAAMATVVTLRRRYPDSPLRSRHITAGAFATLGAWLLSAVVVGALSLPAY